MKRLFSVLCLLSSVLWASAQQPTNVQKGGAAGTNALTGDLVLPAARTLTLSGIVAGTPASGTLNLSNLTLTLPASTLSAYSTTAQIAAAYQPLAADLTSWAALTRASGFDTFTATPSGANLASLLTTALPASKGGTGLTALSANIVTLLGAADYSAARTQLSLVPGTNFLAYPTGTPTGTKFLRDDNSWQAVPALGDLLAANNLSDLANAATARTNLGLAIGTDVQAYDADLASIAGNTTGGFLTRTAANTYTPRTITGTAGEITVTDGDGVSGAPTISLPSTITQATTFSDSTQTTSTTTGGAIFSGGVGIAKALHVGNYMAIGMSAADANNLLDAYKGHNGNTIIRVWNDNAGSAATARLIVGNDASANNFQFILNAEANTTLGGAGSLNVYFTADRPMVLSTQSAANKLTLGSSSTGGAVAITSTVEATTGGAGSFNTPGGIYAAKKIIAGTSISPSGSSATWTAGSGSPEGVVTAVVGSLYSRTDGGAATSLYVKESGSGNTGWVAK